MADVRLPREERMRSLSAIDALFGGGRRGSAFPLRYTWRVTDDAVRETAVCILFSVPKKFFKRANKRNLLKRRMREAYRLSKQTIVDGAAAKGVKLDIAFIYSSKDVADYKTIKDAIQRALGEILGRL